MLVTFILLLVSPASYAANWQWVVSTDDTTIQMDTSNIQKGTLFGGTHIKIWAKYIYNQAAVQRMINNRKKAGASVDGYENLSWRTVRIEFLHTNDSKIWRETSWVDYDSENHVLWSASYQDNKWEEIIPETVAEALFEKAYRN